MTTENVLTSVPDPVPESETAVGRAAGAIAELLDLDTGDSIRAAVAALEAAKPSPAIAERAARLLLTQKGELPVVHAAWKEPLEPFCGSPDGFGPGGYATFSLRVTCQACNDKFGFTEDHFAMYDRWTREGVPADHRTPGAQATAEARAARGR